MTTVRPRRRLRQSDLYKRRSTSAAPSASGATDFFQFTAGQTGKAALTLSGPDRLAAAWQQLGQGRIEGNRLLLDVVAGHTYAVGVAGGGAAIGKYQVDLAMQGAPPATFG